MICLKDFILFLTNSSFALIFTTRNKWRSLQIDTTVFDLIYFYTCMIRSNEWEELLVAFLIPVLKLRGDFCGLIKALLLNVFHVRHDGSLGYINLWGHVFELLTVHINLLWTEVAPIREHPIFKSEMDKCTYSPLRYIQKAVVNWSLKFLSKKKICRLITITKWRNIFMIFISSQKSQRVIILSIDVYYYMSMFYQTTFFLCIQHQYPSSLSFPLFLIFLNDKQIEFAGKCTGTINKMQYTRRGKLSAHT